MTPDDKRTIRKLAAIVVADVVHYSRQMEADEVGTLARLKSLRTEILDPAMRAHDGRLVKLMGDGLLAEFASAIDATEWALSVQRAIVLRNESLPEPARMSLRVGVNVGDVIVEGDDIYGEGVNVAARLEPLAPPGGVCISAAVHDHVSGKIDTKFVSLGERAVKNIARPVSIHCWSPTALDDGDSVPFTPRAQGRKPSLALRAFEATSGSGDAAMLAAAVHDATLGSLSNLVGILILADAARADYIANATIQASGQRYRATVRLLDNRTGEQFWSDRFDGDLSDLFDAQDELAYRVSQSIRFSIYDREVAEMEKVPVTERTTEMILARLGQIIAGANRHEWADAGPKLDSIILAQPAEAGPRAMKACWHLHEVFYGWREISPADRAAAIAAARDAVRCNDRSDFAHMTLSLVHLYCEGDIDRAFREAARALELSPFYAIARFSQGLAWVFGGRPAEGLEVCTHTLKASPRMVMNPRIMQAAAIGAFLTNRHEEAVDWVKRADHLAHDVAPTLLILAASAAAAGLAEDAASARDRLLALFPDFRLGEMRRWPFRIAADHDRFMESLAAAGLPN
ncbi:MAG: adenylate/guanylate cyclase domain-containing protein [Candidatus Binatia bacterium]